MHITQQITQQEIQMEDLWKYKMTQTLTKRLCALCITGILSWQPLKSGKAILPLVPEYLTIHICVQSQHTEYKASLQELTSILLTTTDLSHNPLLSQAAHTLSALLTRCFHTLCGSLNVGMTVKSSCHFLKTFKNLFTSWRFYFSKCVWLVQFYYSLKVQICAVRLGKNTSAQCVTLCSGWLTMLHHIIHQPIGGEKRKGGRDKTTKWLCKQLAELTISRNNASRGKQTGYSWCINFHFALFKTLRFKNKCIYESESKHFVKPAVHPA